jgi:hypothetical protein
MSKGKRKKSFRKLQKGFGRMAEAESVLGRLREFAGKQALGDYRQHAMQYSSKPGEIKAPGGLLQEEQYSTYDYSPWAGQESGGKVQRAFGGKAGTGGVVGRIGDLVQGRGFGGEGIAQDKYSSTDAVSQARAAGPLAPTAPGMPARATNMNALRQQLLKRKFGSLQFFA